MANQLSAEKRLEKITVRLMRNKNYVYLSGILMLGNVYVDETGGPGPCAQGTAATNGRDEWYSRKFVDSLNDKQLAFLRLHESMHKMYRHMTIWKHLCTNPEDRRLANIAMDIVINNKLIKDKDLECPTPVEYACINPEWEDKDTGEIFRILKEMQKNSGKGDGKGKGSGKGLEKLGKGQMDGHDMEGNKELSEEAQKELDRQVDQAIRQGAILAGKMGANVDRDVKELMKPKQDWKALLKDFIKNVCKSMEYSSWSRINRRYVGMTDPNISQLMPGWSGQSVGRIMCAIDCSGSVSQDLMMQFVSECHAIAKEVNPEILDVCYWDAAVGKHEMYKMGETQAEEYITNTKPVGGGGTSPSCIPPYMIQNNIKPMCVVVLTDGFVGGDWGELKDPWPCPILWIIEGSDDVPNCGKFVHVETGG